MAYPWGVQAQKSNSWQYTEEKEFLEICKQQRVTDKLDNCITSAGISEMFVMKWVDKFVQTLKVFVCSCVTFDQWKVTMSWNLQCLAYFVTCQVSFAWVSACLVCVSLQWRFKTCQSMEGVLIQDFSSCVLSSLSGEDFTFSIIDRIIQDGGNQIKLTGLNSVEFETICTAIVVQILPGQTFEGLYRKTTLNSTNFLSMSISEIIEEFIEKVGNDKFQCRPLHGL